MALYFCEPVLILLDGKVVHFIRVPSSAQPSVEHCVQGVIACWIQGDAHHSPHGYTSLGMVAHTLTYGLTTVN